MNYANIFAKMFPERNFCKVNMFPERKIQTGEMFPERKQHIHFLFLSTALQMEWGDLSSADNIEKWKLCNEYVILKKKHNFLFPTLAYFLKKYYLCIVKKMTHQITINLSKIMAEWDDILDHGKRALIARFSF